MADHKRLPKTAAAGFRLLVDAADRAQLTLATPCPRLMEMMLAQCAVESGWGNSKLARTYLNFGGMKWRDFMKPYATPQHYLASDGPAIYCRFKTYNDFVAGYFFRLDEHPSYDGWRDHAATPEDFIKFVGPIWVGLDEKRNAEYVRKVLRVYQTRTEGILQPPEVSA